MNLPTQALGLEARAKRLHEQTQRLAVESANAARRDSADAFLGLATRTEEAITSAFELIHNMRALKRHANCAYRERKADDD